MSESRLLLIEDDEVFSRVLSRALERRGFAVTIAHSTTEARNLFTREPPDFVVLDLNLNGESGIRLITPLLEANRLCRVLVLTGYASIATAVQAIKLGAIQYLAKPVDADAIVQALLGDDSADTPVVADPLPVDRVEWEHIQRVLAENDGNISVTARVLKMHRRTLQRKLRKRPSPL
jgi:two-component system, response regulator RegA